MRFEAAWCWFLLPPLLLYVWWLSRRSYAQLGPAARRISLALRATILALLLAVATRPSYLRHSAAGHVVYVLDASKSVSIENLDAALQDIDRLAREATQSGPRQRVSVVAFGKQPALVVRGQSAWDGWPAELREKLRYPVSLPDLYRQRTALISNDTTGDRAALDKLQGCITDVERFRDQVAGDRTDVDAALCLALNCGAAGERCTIYVFTDANFNQGEWTRGWDAAAAAGTTVHAVMLDKPLPPEVAIADLALPPTVRVNQGFSAELRIASTIATTAELRIFKDGYAEPPRTVTLRAGENGLRLPGLYFREKGFHTVEVALHAATDTQLENNTARALVIVPGEARVLYVDSDEKQMPYLKSALELEGMLVEARPASGVPQNLSELLSFDAFILSNVPADRLSRTQMQMIQTYVQDCGGGFLMLGGDESFGLGGYYNTPIEEILPVRMPIQKDLTRPALALMLLIDKSGSMDGVKIQLAKRAAISSAEAINPRDQIGVIGFDSEARVLLELTPAADRATVTSHIAALDAGGGTFMYPAMEDARQRLSESNARRKHVIILSDGQTQGYGYEELAQSMAADGMTISTVGIGEGADMRLLETVASAGGGRTYFTNDFYSIPQIFTKEAMRASKNMLVERLVQPVAVGHDAALDEIDIRELPLLTGYVATTPKAAANLILASDSGDPLLAKWRYGLGWTAAFTSEPKPRWAEDWLEWPDFAKFWSQLVRSITGADLEAASGLRQGRLSIECSHTLDDSGVTLTADVRDAAGDFAADVTAELSELTPIPHREQHAEGSSGPAHALTVVRKGPGLFEAHAADITYGKDQQYVWRVSPHVAPTPGGVVQAATRAALPGGNSQQHDTPGAQSASYGFVYSFSPEFATLGVADETVARIRSRGVGDVMTVEHSALVLNPATTTTWLQLWPYLLISALLAVPLDIFVRRIG